MLKDITRILIENMLDQLWKQAQDSPERAARNLIDLGLQFSKGTFQKKFLSYAQELLQHQDSAYYSLVVDLFHHVDKKSFVTFSMNLGYNGCSKGMKMIRAAEKEKGFSIPWSLRVMLDENRLREDPQSYLSIVSQGKKMGIYVYVLFLEEGSEEKILPILEQCPDCAFLVFLEGTGLSEDFLTGVRNCGNTMIYVYADTDMKEKCRKLRKQSLLYGIYRKYGDQDKEDILEKTWLECQRELEPHFIFLCAESGCGMETRTEVYEKVLAIRREQKYPSLCIDAGLDLREIDKIVSGDVCELTFDRDGTSLVCVNGLEETGQNIFESSLEEILRSHGSRQPVAAN